MSRRNVEPNATQALTLLDSTTIAGAVSGSVGTTALGLTGMKYLIVEAIFVYAAGGTTVKAWIQTKVGDTWRDIMNFAFTTSSATKHSAVNATTALAAVIAVSDAALTDDTILSGFLGDSLRVKYTTTGTYTGVTTLQIKAVAKG